MAPGKLQTMPGVRIAHPDMKGVTLILSQPAKPEIGRKAKDLHIHLDENGTSIVSDTVWANLQAAEAAGLWEKRFVLIGEVMNPPAQEMSTPGGNIEIVRTMRQATGADGEIFDDTQGVVQKIKDAIGYHRPPSTTPRVEVNRTGGGA